MNIILADRAEKSSDKESRNGLGKTTFLRIVHFCLGSDFNKKSALAHPDLGGVTFGLDIDIAGRLISVSRNTSKPKKITIQGDLSNWPIDPDSITQAGVAEILVGEWTDLLGHLMFSAPVRDSTQEHRVSFRTLIGYFARIGRAAFNDPFDHIGKQKAAVVKTHTAFLMGLNWHQIRRWHDLEQQAADAKKLIEAMQAFEDAGNVESIGDLEAQGITLQQRLDAKERAIAAFQVRDDYHHIEQRLVDTDRDIHSRINANHSDRQLRAFYMDSVNELDGKSVRSTPASLLQQAGVVFQESALRHILDVAAFHEQVYRNRVEFLHAEITRLNNVIATRDREIDRLSASKSEALAILQTTGALNTYLALQQEHREILTELQRVLARIEDRKRYERQRDQIELELATLRIDMRTDFEERQSICDKARGAFSKYTGELYEMPGRLLIDIDKKGAHFGYVINREGSDGVEQMVVFCYDLMLAGLWQVEPRHPGFLIHDSALFADVDARQKARAIKLAHAEASRLGFQYICCLNSDALPTEDLGDFAIQDFVRLHLSDEGPATRLLGIALPPHGTDA